MIARLYIIQTLCLDCKPKHCFFAKS